MKGIQSNGFLPIIAQAIAEMEELHGEFASIDEINLAELGRRTGISRAKLRRLKANGFCETPHGLTGQSKEHLLDGYSSVLDNLLRSGVSNSTVCLARLQAIGFSGSRSTVKRYIASHKHLIIGLVFKKIARTKVCAIFCASSVCNKLLRDKLCGFSYTGAGKKTGRRLLWRVWGRTYGRCGR